ncbi:hypothetical protein [Streptomyces sp. NPDC014733]|uniref:hypothetical protein n=1 Tax=Streptomyces sp. NPDC014733 TaxID=3364885 RepID=UPI0036F62F9B
MRTRRWAPLLATGALAVLAPAPPPAQASAADPLYRFHRQRPAWHRCAAATPAAFWSVVRGDTAWPRDLAQYRRAAARDLICEAPGAPARRAPAR